MISTALFFAGALVGAWTVLLGFFLLAARPGPTSQPKVIIRFVEYKNRCEPF